MTIVIATAILFVPPTEPPKTNQLEKTAPAVAVAAVVPAVPLITAANVTAAVQREYASHAFTFWIYFSLRLMLMVFVGICFTLLDGDFDLILVSFHV